MITDEPAGRTTNSGGEMRGTTRWMAPELMNPEEFGFIGELLKQLPSTSTDIYAIGMTILEVSACPYLLTYWIHLLVGSNRVPSVQRHHQEYHSRLEGHERGSAGQTTFRFPRCVVGLAGGDLGRGGWSRIQTATICIIHT